jgi:hypothetical protein
MKLHIAITQKTRISGFIAMDTTDLNTYMFRFCSAKGSDFWMTSYFDRPAEEQPDDQQIGLKCVPVRMDT